MRLIPEETPIAKHMQRAMVLHKTAWEILFPFHIIMSMTRTIGPMQINNGIYNEERSITKYLSITKIKRGKVHVFT